MSENGMKNEWIEPYEDVALLRTLLSTPHRGGDGKQKKSLGSSGVSVGQKRSAPMEKEGTVPERKVKVKKNPRLGRVTAGELNWPELDWSDFKLDSSPESVQDDTPKDENLQEVQQPMFFEVLDAPYKRYSVDSLMIQRIMNDHHYADIKKAPPSNQIFNVGKTENKHILYSKYIPRKYLTDCGSFPSFFNRPVNDVPMDVDIPRGNPSASLNGSNGMAHSTHARDHQNKNTRPQLDSENGRMVRFMGFFRCLDQQISFFCLDQISSFSGTPTKSTETTGSLFQTIRSHLFSKGRELAEANSGRSDRH